MNICYACRSDSLYQFSTFQQWAKVATRMQGEPYDVLNKIQKIPSAIFDKFLKCKNCHLIHAYPLPNNETLMAYYSTYSDFVDFNIRAANSINRSVDNINIIKKIISHGNFLDIGCGIGGATYNAYINGYESIGIDIDRLTLDDAKKRFPCKFELCNINEFSQRSSTFDIVYASEIIEHVPDINIFVAALADLTRLNKYIFITTPEVSFEMQYDAQKFLEWGMVGPPEHLFYFTRNNIEILLKNHGIKVIKFFEPYQGSLRVLARKM